MMQFIIWYVVPMVLGLLTALLCWKSERFSRCWIKNSKRTFEVLLWLSVIPVVNVVYSCLLVWWVFICSVGTIWDNTLGKIKINYPPHLK